MPSNKLNGIFEKVYQRAVRLMDFDRFYVALYDAGTKEVEFPLVMENDRHISWPAKKVEADLLPDGIWSRVETHLHTGQDAVETSVHLDDWKILGAPMRQENHIIGALVAEKRQREFVTPPEAFDEGARRLLATMAQQTAIAVENARLYQRLERKIDALKALNVVGQRLASGLDKTEADILNLLYQSAVGLGIDSANMYVAFYTENPQQPDAFENNVPEHSELHGDILFKLVYENGHRIPNYPDRSVKNGLTEYVIKTRLSLNPPDVSQAYQELAQDHIGKIPRSWLGVPILTEGKVLGVIVLRNDETPDVYTADDQEILEILAGQVAVALQNLRLYQQLLDEQKQRLAAERLSVMGITAAEFAHRMNNLAGTIPIRVNIAKSLLDETSSRDGKINKQLDIIQKEAQQLLEAAQVIRESTEQRAEEQVNINELLDTALESAKRMCPSSSNIEIHISKNQSTPEIMVERNALLETLTNVIRNGLEAMEEKGELWLAVEREGQSICITIQDDGPGISKSELPKIFDLFYSTKGAEGLGFGLWRAKTFIEQMGGKINVVSETEKGTTFIIRLPIRSDKK